ncbi:Alpha-(1,6)-fucosyltransferase fragment, family GT23 [Chondrus crispus]|uniref:Alpha-(1,6)-fucosyltransferase, family GT23 n=1 Tax=Chondrus crispus TaxID=2769 RepID=R7QMX9_CHOCR|nr:Alpha-(1,6)-fucosyltransferase fragment, family GT23 [Chondrus crispus]CDF38740.1 Alpha-(1,6)-fucosyltransferase fragment, family GT23 [Chondrus crispus]
MSGGAALSRELAKRLWRLNEATAAAVRVVLEEASVWGAGEYVGVHVRRGDKSKEVADVPLWRYAAAVRAVSGEEMAVFVAADDGASVRGLRQLLAGRKVVAIRGAEGRGGHDQLATNRGYMKENYGRVVELLAEVEALRGAKVFVGTFSSNLGRLVHVLREGDERNSVSLDDRWAPGVAWRTFGERYCEMEPVNEVYCTRVREGRA